MSLASLILALLTSLVPACFTHNSREAAGRSQRQSSGWDVLDGVIAFSQICA